MTKTMKAGVIGGIAGIAIAILAFAVGSGLKSCNSETPLVGPESTGPIDPPPTPMKEIKKDPISPSAVERVRSRTLKGEFQLTGHGEDAKWGIEEGANFVYTVIVDADSQIVEKETLSNGKIKVTENRTFNTVQDSMVVSKIDVKLALDTLPIEKFSTMIDTACVLWASMTGDVETPAVVMTSKNYVAEILKDVDGTSVKTLLGAVGIDLPDEMKNYVEKLANTTIKKALGGIRSISGKSYKLVYYQEENGKPLYIKITYSNGEEVIDEEEQMVLRRVNAFIDYDMVPDKDCEPGATWEVQASNIQELFDPYAEGSYSGKIGVERKVNTPDGDWYLQLKPSKIDVVNSNNNSTGYYNLQQGHALVNPKLVSISELFASGTASVQKVSKHHWLFTSRISGECEFQGKLVSTPKE